MKLTRCRYSLFTLVTFTFALAWPVFSHQGSRIASKRSAGRFLLPLRYRHDREPQLFNDDTQLRPPSDQRSDDIAGMVYDPPSAEPSESDSESGLDADQSLQAEEAREGQRAKFSKRGNPESSSCGPTPNILSQFGRWASNHTDTSVVALMVPTNVMFRYKIKGSTEDEESSIPLAGAKNCAEHDYQTDSRHAHQASICPWYWQVNYDPNRLPAALPEAKCKCNKPHGSKDGLICRELNYSIRTLKFSGPDCSEVREVMSNISVACVAMRGTTIDVPGVVAVHKVAVDTPVSKRNYGQLDATENNGNFALPDQASDVRYDKLFEK